MEMGSFCRPKVQNAKKTWKRVSSINPEMVNTIASDQEHWDSLGRTALNYERLDAFPKKRREAPKDIYVLTHSKHVVNVVMLSAINFFTEPILSIFFPNISRCDMPGRAYILPLCWKEKGNDLRNSSWFTAVDNSWRIGEGSQHFPKTRKLKKSEREEKIPKFPLFF